MKKLTILPSKLKIQSKRAKRSWRGVLWVILILLLVNTVVGYLILSGYGPTPGSGLENAVVRIHSADRMGTGFFVSGTYVLTAAHVAGDVGTSLTLENARSEQWTGTVVASGYSEWSRFVLNQTQVQAGATPHDWALIEISGSYEHDPLFLGSEADAFQGADVFLAGHPHDQPLTMTKGVISRIDATEILTDGEIDPGFSGGPMIMVEQDGQPEDGVVVGIVVSCPEGMTTVKTAVPIHIVVQKCSEAGFDLFL